MVPLVLALLAVQASADPPARYAALLERGLARGYPGLVLAIDRPGEPPWSGAAGLADVARGEAMTADHAVHLASVTKLFTAVAALRLCDAGELALDDPIAAHLDPERLPALPDLPHADEVTVAMLLDHSSGFAATNNDPEYLRAWIGPDAGAAAAWTSADFVALAARARPAGRPGAGRWYSDTNYVLLGEVVASVAGAPLREHVGRTLFAPLGLRSAHYLGDAAPAGVPLARGYLRFSQPLAGVFDPGRFPEVAPGLFDTTSAGERIDGAAAIVASAPDLMRFGAAVWRGELLSAESRARLASVAEGLEDAVVGTKRQGIVTARRTRHGVVLTSEGDGPGGSHALVAFHPPTGTLVVGLVTGFGGFDEHDFLVDEAVAAAIAPREQAGF